MNRWILFVPFVLQALAMAIDELHFHRRRGLPRWERVGHPLDTLSAAACFAWLVYAEPSRPDVLGVYVLLVTFSCVLVTKDEFVHKKHCGPVESWLHALLFVLHPIVFMAAGWLWFTDQGSPFFAIQLAVTLCFATYQALYWGPWNHSLARKDP